MIMECEAWTKKDKTFHWRRRQLDIASQKHGEKYIVYKKKLYAESIVRAGNERDKFYRDHEPELS